MLIFYWSELRREKGRDISWFVLSGKLVYFSE